MEHVGSRQALGLDPDKQPSLEDISQLESDISYGLADIQTLRMYRLYLDELEQNNIVRDLIKCVIEKITKIEDYIRNKDAKWDPNEVPFEQLKQIVFMIYMQELRHPVTQASGFNVIHDFANVGLRYLKYSTPQTTYLLNHVSFDVMPGKYLGYHLVNGNFLMNLLLRLSKPFLPEFVKNILHVHSSVEELLEFFPRSMLPVQYGGVLTEYYMTDWLRKTNEQHRNYPEGGQKNIF